MDLIKYERPKREMKQFTITVETKWQEELREIAKGLGMSLHGLVITIIYTYLKQQKPDEQKNENFTIEY
jgi:hypothetical protein